MNNLLYLIIGIVFLLFGIYSLFSGETIGFSIGSDSGRMVTMKDDIVEYWLFVILSFVFGGILVWDPIVDFFKLKK